MGQEMLFGSLFCLIRPLICSHLDRLKILLLDTRLSPDFNKSIFSIKQIGPKQFLIKEIIITRFIGQPKTSGNFPKPANTLKVPFNAHSVPLSVHSVPFVHSLESPFHFIK